MTKTVRCRDRGTEHAVDRAAILAGAGGWRLCERGRHPRPPATPDSAPSGRPRLKGTRLKGTRPPTLAAAAAAATAGTGLTGAPRYGTGGRAVEVASDPAAWYHSGRPPVPLRWLPVRAPRGRCATQALRRTDPEAAPEPVLARFVQRRQRAVTVAEARRHLGRATQRQRSGLAVCRTTPAVPGPFSLVTRPAHRRPVHRRPAHRRPAHRRPAHRRPGAAPGAARPAARYRKDRPAFADAVARARRDLRRHQTSCASACAADLGKAPRVTIERPTDTRCYAA